MTQQRDAKNETIRLAEIERLRVLDTAREPAFDHVVSAVAALFDVPCALITLVDRERCWYKAEVGFGIDEMSRDDNMCDAVLRHDGGVLLIKDARLEPPELVRPLLKAGFRFYAGAPVRSPDGIAIGTVAAAGPELREASESQLHILADMAAIVGAQLEMRLAAERMAERDEELRRLNADLATASRNKSEFLASMSHELRTPLNGILGASELLGQELFGPLNAKQQEYIGDIHQSGRHLLRLIEDVLDLSRIEAGQFELQREPLDVALVMEGCASVVRGLVTAGSIELSVTPPEEPLTILADRRRITQVACNLLSNALKFSADKGRVRFSARRDGAAVIFAVEDEGPGIAAHLQERIFEQFFRVASDREGTGLGLPLARQLVELHGGRIWVESVEGAGSRFYFSLPVGE